MVLKTKSIEEEVVKVGIDIPRPHSKSQDEYVRSKEKRIVVKAGRRFGKTVGAAIIALMGFLGVCSSCLGKGCLDCDMTGKVRPKRVLYAAPTAEQVGKFWNEVCSVLRPGIDGGYFKKDETEHYIEIQGTERRIKAKTAWNANTMRGDYADVVILEEYQLWNEDGWEDVVQPMLLDNDGRAIFIFTPPSLKSEGVSKAKDPRHASKLFKKAELDKTGRWKTFHFTSYDNPTLNQTALKELTESGDMSQDSFRREILAEDDEIELSWLVYGKWNEKTCKIKRFDIPKTWNIFVGHDFGSANPAALFLAQVRKPLPIGAPEYMRMGDLVAFKEYSPGGGRSAAEHTIEFKNITKDYVVEKRVGGNRTTEDEIRQAYSAHGWVITAPLIPKVNAQLDRVMGLLELNKLYVFDDMYGLLNQMQNCMWELDVERRITNKVKDEARWHLLACLRYIGSEFKPETIGVNVQSKHSGWRF